MNLELLDPFRKQIPDRVDATLVMPAFLQADALGSSTPTTTTTTSMEEEDDSKAAYHVAYNRRGRFMAVGYGSGLIGVYDTLSRNLVATYPLTSEGSTGSTAAPVGVTSLSWSRRSRTLLAGAVGDSLVRLYDTTHPYGPEECLVPVNITTGSSNNANLDDDEDGGGGVSTPNAKSSSGAAAALLLQGERPIVRRSNFDTTSTGTSSTASRILMNMNQQHNNNSSDNEDAEDDEDSVMAHATNRAHQNQHHNMEQNNHNNQFATHPRILQTQSVKDATSQQHHYPPTPSSSSSSVKARFPALFFRLPQTITGSLEVHPQHTTAGLAVLQDGSLILFWAPPQAWYDDSQDTQEPKVLLCTLFQGNNDNVITCASFDPRGQRIYAATKQGTLMGFDVESIFHNIVHGKATTSPLELQQACKFTIRIPGGSSVWHLLVSRDGKYTVLNCADGSLKLYQNKDCWGTISTETIGTTVKPLQVFQDVVNKQVKFASCALSGDGEYIVGGANEVRDDRYELYIWNTSTGALMDKLNGAAVNLYSVAWHPTRSFLAIATSDGLVDVWAPKVNWTAFAPDFQALPMNVEYVEQEDEFDLDPTGKQFASTLLNDATKEPTRDNDEEDEVDVVTIEPVPVFASDSEEEEDVFYFETKFTNTIGNRTRHATND